MTMGSLCPMIKAESLPWLASLPEQTLVDNTSLFSPFHSPLNPFNTPHPVLRAVL